MAAERGFGKSELLPYTFADASVPSKLAKGAKFKSQLWSEDILLIPAPNSTQPELQDLVQFSLSSANADVELGTLKAHSVMKRTAAVDRQGIIRSTK